MTNKEIAKIQVVLIKYQGELYHKIKKKAKINKHFVNFYLAEILKKKGYTNYQKLKQDAGEMKLADYVRSLIGRFAKE